MTTVETTHGLVEGIREGGLDVFRGIPYASPPVGERRFRAPQPLEPWTGVRSATGFSAIAPQPPPVRQMFPGEPLEQAEDSLYLNVWTPGTTGRRPVMVWIHGGAFVTGSGAGVLYRGDRLAARGDTVVVTINYRLGVLGFGAHAELRDPETGDTGNWGIRDQIAALGWVRDNIASFGGDPDNVTVFGESAGAMSVSTLLGVPAARGLFRRAIAQSGANVDLPLERAQHTTEAVLAELGLDATDVARLRELPPDAIVEAQRKVSLRRPPGGGVVAFVPVHGEQLLPRPALDHVRDGGAAEVALLVGTNRDEMKYFAMGRRGVTGMETEDDLVRRLERTVKERAADAVVAYRKAREARGDAVDPFSLWSAIESDRVFRVPAMRLAQAQAPHQAETFAYFFTQESPAAGGILGSCHALEIPFVFGTHSHSGVNLFAGEGPEVTALSEQMMDAWLAFARTGYPSVPAAEWPSYDAGRRATMVLGPRGGVEDAPWEDERLFWD